MTMTLAKRAYNLDEAAVVYSVSRRRLQQAIDEHKLIAHYNGSRPLLHLEDLDAWFQALPTERP